MPTYTLRNKVTGEEFEKFMSISSYKEYIQENPDVEAVINGAPTMMDPVRAGVKKVPSGFKDVLQQIHARTPGSDLKKNNAF